MTAYAIAHLHSVDVNNDIVRYLEAIDGTLAPFGGRYIIHGGTATILEGEWPADLVVVEFPTKRHAEEWYQSPAYQAILPLRAENSKGNVVILEGVPPTHRATDILTA